MTRYVIYKEPCSCHDHGNHRWVVREACGVDRCICNQGALYSYASTWFGAWRLASQAAGQTQEKILKRILAKR